MSPLSDGHEPFHPTFTHQMFGMEEDIVGHIKPQVQLRYTNPTMSVLALVSSEKASPIYHDAILQRVSLAAPQPVKGASKGFTTNEEEFKKEQQAITAPYTPPGKLVDEYDSKGLHFEVWNWKLEGPTEKSTLARLETLAYWLIDGKEWPMWQRLCSLSIHLSLISSLSGLPSGPGR